MAPYERLNKIAGKTCCVYFIPAKQEIKHTQIRLANRVEQDKQKPEKKIKSKHNRGK